MKKTLILMALVVFSAVLLTACGAKGVASDGNAFTSYGDALVSSGNVAPVASAGNAG